MKISKRMLLEDSMLRSLSSFAFSLGFANVFCHLYLAYSRLNPQPTFGPTVISTGMPPRAQLIFIVTLSLTYMLGMNTKVLDQFFLYQRGRFTRYFSALFIPILIQFSDIFLQRTILAVLLLFLLFLEISDRSGVGNTDKFKNPLRHIFFFAIILVLTTVPGLLQIPRLSKSLWLESTILVGIFVIGAIVSGVLSMVALQPRGKPQLNFIIGPLIYCIFIPWQQMQWRTDGFHDAETFLAQKTISAGYSPQHGLGRIGWPTYLTDFFGASTTDLYTILIGSKLVFGLVAPLLIFTLFRISKSIYLAVLVTATFVLGYIFTPQDINIGPLAILFLVFSLKQKTLQSKIGRYFLFAIYSISILYSIETMLFGILSIISLLVLTKRTHLREVLFFFLTQLLFLSFPQVRSAWGYIPDALTQDGNLLERPFVLSVNFESIFIVVSFAVLIFFFPRVILDVLRKSKLGDLKSTLLYLIFSSGLLMVSRSFNRADFGHILYGLQFLPFVLLAYWVGIQDNTFANRTDNTFAKRTRVFNTDVVLIITFAPLLFFGFFLNQGKAQGIGSHHFYGLSTSTVVPNSLKYSEFEIPNNDFLQIYPNKNALDNLRSVLQNRTVLDLSNNLIATQVLSGSRITISPINLLVGSGSGEQRLVNLINMHAFDVVVWGSNHWSQNLDGVSFEDRTPLLTASILKKYKFSEIIGDFVLFSPALDSSGLSYIPYSDSSILWSYDLGFAPQVTKPLSGDRIRYESNVESTTAMTVDIICRGEQIQNILKFKVLVNNQVMTNYINLSNRYSHLLLKASGNFECTSKSDFIKNLVIISE